MTIKRIAVIALMTSLAIILSIVESFIPVFIPGVKLGLANVIILLMLVEFKWYEALLTNALRIVLVGLLRGTLLGPAFLMSLSGGALSYLVMLVFTRFKLFSPVGISVLGSVFHCVGQILVAIGIIGSSAVVYYLPFIGILSVASGVLSGIVCSILINRKIVDLLYVR